MYRTTSLLIASAVAAFGLALPGVALATPDADTDTNSQRATAGEDCTGKDGREVTIRARGGARQLFRCERRAGDGYAPRWHRIATVPAAPGSDGYGPTPAPSTSSPAPSPSRSTSRSARPDVPADTPQLPVTGPAIWVVVVVGGILVAAGIRLLVVGRRRPPAV